MKPRIFIGSSKESVKIAEKVKSLLDGEYVCQLWCDNFFDLGQCTYHELLKKSLSFDCHSAVTSIKTGGRSAVPAARCALLIPPAVLPPGVFSPCVS